MLPYLKRTPIRTQLSMLLLFILAIVVIIIFTNYSKAAKVVEQKNSEYFTETILQMNQTIASNADVVKRLLQNISYNTSIVQKYLNETDPAAKFSAYTQLTSYISDMIGMKDGIFDIAILGNDGTPFNTSGEINNLLPFKDEIPEKRLYYFLGLKTIPINLKDRNFFVAGTRIYSTIDFNKQEEIGTLLIVLDADALLGSPEQAVYSSGSKVYLLDRKGNLFYSNDPMAALGSAYDEGASGGEEKDYFVQRGEIPDIDGEIIVKLPRSELLRGIEDIRKQAFMIVLIALLLLAVPYLLVVNNILQPLKKLMQLMNEIKLGKLGNLKKRIQLQGYAEIIVVANNFNQMLDEVDDLTHRLIDSRTKLYELELVKKQSELAYLQSQVNPHFLYNTLESIKGMAAEEGADDIFNMTKALARVFRYSIKGKDKVPLGEELLIVQSYIEIQKVRFRSRLEVEYRFPDELLRLKVPKMILQPIVENAIFHGIEPKVGVGLLRLEADLADNRLYLAIKDNGVGMDKHTLEALMNNDAPGTGIGLANVNNRIKLTYGEDYGLRLRSSPGEGTEAVVIMPVGGEIDV
ncbi:sensor histidine kinase [Cohnella fermenti]|uniref:histidine kinase n=1 Tax=Cohnella fermenti TaxID=2565925 RepID=A0A4S4C5W0_9BACL|nr:sensor histidine kinase [Cohnella fermenti]THF83243.1 sensor histidine kinase [Cohnella fermenti]